MADTTPFLMYKGRPLVRSGNVLYYGSMAEKYVIVMQILSTKDENDMTMAEKIRALRCTFPRSSCDLEGAGISPS